MMTWNNDQLITENQNTKNVVPYSFIVSNFTTFDCRKNTVESF